MDNQRYNHEMFQIWFDPEKQNIFQCVQAITTFLFSSKFELISFELVFSGNKLAGKGLIPRDFNLFNFSLRICSCSGISRLERRYKFNKRRKEFSFFFHELCIISRKH